MIRPVTLLIALCFASGSVLAERTVAITLDDLPFTGGPNDAATVGKEGQAIVDALVKHGAPAAGFVTGRNALTPGQADLRMGLLESWAAAGLDLENHGQSHLSFTKTDPQAYLDDLLAGQAIPQFVLARHKRKVRFYRAPFNHTGASPEAKQALLQLLEERGMQLAPFTVEHSDYIYNALYVEAEDEATRARIGAAYLEALDRAFAFAESLSRETFDREIAQIFLIHTNLINAHYLDAILTRLGKRGYRFVSMADAMQDPAYQTLETYAGPHGISWFHRWRKSLGLENRLRDEPDPEAWVLEAYRQR